MTLLQQRTRFSHTTQNKELEQIIDGWFDIDSELLFVIEFDGSRIESHRSRSNTGCDRPYLMCVLDCSSNEESLPFDMMIGEGLEARIIEWRLNTLYLCMLEEDSWWPIHWPMRDEIITTYYKGKSK